MRERASKWLTNLEVSDRRGLLAGVAGTFLFCLGVVAFGERLAAFAHLPDAGAAWYYWKLAEPTATTRVSAWLGYGLHQAAFWLLIYFGQKSFDRSRDSQQRVYSGRLHPLNIAALAINGVFCLLHLAQTHLFYDGLAQDVSIFSSFGSVAFLLIWVLLLENDRRGVFFGRRLPVSAQVMDVARRYHGYVFAWAVVYTFWYHPAEATSGHLLGFFYTVLIMVQGSLMFTRAHLNRYWTFALGILVLVHGTTVAVMQGQGLWPMFFFGFLGVFIVTQMHGLPIARWLRVALSVGYVIAVAAVYAGRGVAKLNEIVRIPFIDYVTVLLLWGMLALIAKATRGRTAQP